MALVADRAVLTQEAGELTVEPGEGMHEGLDWCRNPNLSWLPAHTINLDPFFRNEFRSCIGQPRCQKRLSSLSR